MGRGAQTVKDHFSAIFGERRGSGRPEEEVLPGWKSYVIAGDWNGSEAPDGGILFRFPRLLTLDDQDQIRSALEEAYLAGGEEIEQRTGNIFYLMREDQVDSPDLTSVANSLALTIGLEVGQVEALIPEENLPDGTLKVRPVMDLQPA